MKRFSEVIIIGGGPSGSFAAFNLAKRGVGVTVFEEHSKIGYPLHCAGHLSIKGLKSLGLDSLPPKILENTFYGACFNSPSGNKFSIRFSSPITCVVNRALFDRHIINLAKDAGSKINLNSRVKSLIIKNGFVKGVFVEHKNRVEKYLANIVIDAEGIGSRILSNIGLQRFKRQMLVHAVKAEIEDYKSLDPKVVQVFLSNNFASGFYAWLIPKLDGKASVGLATNKGNPKELLKKFILEKLSISEKTYRNKISQLSFHPITLGGIIPKTYSNGFLVVGDAASQVKPTTGGGVIMGMTCARIAAEVIFESLQENNFSLEFLRTYQERCQKILGFDMKFMLKVRTMLNVLPDRKIDEAICFCQKFGLDKILKHFNDIDFQGKSFLRVLWNPRVPIALFYLFYLYLSTTLTTIK
jgi:digeranylgeranylglycerophospholipid reductase